MPAIVPKSASALSARAVGLMLLLVTSVGWGLNWPAVKLLLQEWPPLFARGLAGLIAAGVLALVATAAGQRIALPRKLIGRVVASAFFNVFAWMGLSTLALHWLRAGEGALIVYTMPAWAMLIAWPVQRRRPAVRGMAGLALCLVGVGLLFGGNGLSLGPEKLPGILLALASALLFALGTVVLEPLPLPPFTLVAWQLGIGCLPMLLAGLVFERPAIGTLSAVGVGTMIYMTIVPMGICYLTWFAALRRLPPSTAAITTMLTPVVGVAAASVILGEPFGVREVAAIALTVTGIGLAVASRPPKA